MPNQNWPTWNAQSKRRIAAEVHAIREIHEAGDNWPHFENLWQTQVLPLRHILLDKPQADEANPSLISQVKKTAVQTGPNSRLGGDQDSYIALATDAATRPTGRCARRLAWRKGGGRTRRRSVGRWRRPRRLP